MDARILSAHVIESGAKVLFFTRTVGEDAGTRAGAAEIEAQHGAADPSERLRRLIDDLRVHRAAEFRVRVAEHDRGAHAAGEADAGVAIVADGSRRDRLVEERLEASCRSCELTLRHAVVLR